MLLLIQFFIRHLEIRNWFFCLCEKVGEISHFNIHGKRPREYSVRRGWINSLPPHAISAFSCPGAELVLILKMFLRICWLQGSLRFLKLP